MTSLEVQRRLDALAVSRQAKQNRKQLVRMASWEADLGRKFGRWTVLRFDHTKGPHSFMLCRCECGKERLNRINTLRMGRSLSCGCLRRDLKNALKFQASGEPEYQVWRSMRNRCNSSNPANHRYNGRGITVCPEWQHDFDRFYKDMGPRPTPAHTVERKDNNKGYSPDNCVWATRKEQARNRRNQVWLTLHGVTKSLAEWCEQLQLDYKRVYQRVHKLGWPVERALS